MPVCVSAGRALHHLARCRSRPGRRAPSLVEQDVLRLHVAVDDALGVGVVERLGHAVQDGDRRVRRRGARASMHARRARRRRSAASPSRGIGLLSMPKRRSGRCWGARAGRSTLASRRKRSAKPSSWRNSRRQDLEGHVAVEAGLVGLVDGGHAAAAERIEDPVGAGARAPSARVARPTSGHEAYHPPSGRGALGLSVTRYCDDRVDERRAMARILLVEDNEMNRDMLSPRLQRKGHEVLLAADGMQAILIAASEPRPDPARHEPARDRRLGGRAPPQGLAQPGGTHADRRPAPPTRWPATARRRSRPAATTTTPSPSSCRASGQDRRDPLPTSLIYRRLPESSALRSSDESSSRV